MAIKGPSDLQKSPRHQIWFKSSNKKAPTHLPLLMSSLTFKETALYFEKCEDDMKSVMARVAGCVLRQPVLERSHGVQFVQNGSSGRPAVHAASYYYCRRIYQLLKPRIDERYRRSTDQKVSRKKGLAVAAFCNAATEWSVYRVAGDGRCMFRALVQGEKLGGEREAICVLSSEEETVKADTLRGKICDELLLRREDVEPFLESKIEDYVRRMRMEGTWGGEPELAMAAHVLQRKVVVYMLKSNVQGPLFLEKISEYEPSVVQKTHDNTEFNLPLSSSSSHDQRASDSVDNLEERLSRPINLLYSGSCHYDALVLPSTL